MSTFISAPYPTTKVTSVLPDPEQTDSRSSQSQLTLVRGSTNVKKWGYVKSSDKVNLSATWVLTRAKDAELAEFIRVYHTATWLIEFGHEGKKWSAQLIGRPVRRETFDRQDDNNQRTGNEVIRVTLEFSAKLLP